MTPDISTARANGNVIEAEANFELDVDTRALTKHYGEITAVNGLNLRVRRGEVYGFVGPNGAGKTTAMRMLVGLIRPSSGSASVLGKPAGSRESLAGTGAMIEEPAFYPYLSGSDNLRVLARLASVPSERVDRVLATVEMTDRAKDAFRTYSMGMKQRLGVAAALLKDPQLLILDEPTNGLDPQGITDMRVLLRSLADEGRTVLLSSHLMSEVEQICDRIGIIRGGQLVAEGTLAELRGHQEIRVKAQPPARARELIEGLPFVDAVRSSDRSLYLQTEIEHAAQVNRLLVEAGIEVSELVPALASLEEVFLEIVGGKEKNHEYVKR
jgi:ABC-type multidrug transport system ATPase subunit